MLGKCSTTELYPWLSLFKIKISLHSPSWPQSQDPSASQMLGSQACATTTTIFFGVGGYYFFYLLVNQLPSHSFIYSLTKPFNSGYTVVDKTWMVSALIYKYITTSCNI
jgi:hypothetical protein